MSEPYDYEALWMKAKLFLNRAMDDGPTRTPEEQMLWAALALELLAKAALAKVSPLLVAEPTESGNNLLIAVGLAPKTRNAKFTTVAAKTLFIRCERAFRPFSAEEAQRIVHARNEYLHGTDIGFMSIPVDNWWSRYWALATTLVTALDRELYDLLGSRDSIAEDYLAQNSRNIESQVEALVQRARQRHGQKSGGHLSVRVGAEMDLHSDPKAHLAYGVPTVCPACGSSTGWLEGDNVVEAEVVRPDESNGLGEAVRHLTIAADYFSCSACRLVLRDYEFIEHAGLDSGFDLEDPSFDPYDIYDEPDYGND